MSARKVRHDVSTRVERGENHNESRGIPDHLDGHCNIPPAEENYVNSKQITDNDESCASVDITPGTRWKESSMPQKQPGMQFFDSKNQVNKPTRHYKPPANVASSFDFDATGCASFVMICAACSPNVLEGPVPCATYT